MENHVIPRQYIRSNCAEDAFQWLLTGDVKAESESEIRAALDQALQTKCRATKRSQQTRLYHIISACPLLAQLQYVKRHDGVCVLNCTVTCVRQ